MRLFFVLSLRSPFILFNFPLIFILMHSPSLTLNLQTQFLFYCVVCQVAELKSELKLRSLPVSGTKTDLIERLRTYRELDGGSDITSLPTAGGAEGAEKSSMTAANPPHNDTSQQPRQQHQFQRHPPSSLTSLSGELDHKQDVYLAVPLMMGWEMDQHSLHYLCAQV